MEQRTQHRIQAAVAVQIQGIDANGESFAETTEAIEVSRRGLSIFTRRDLRELSQITVTLPGRGPTRPGEGPSDFFSEAAVVRVVKEGDQNRVSLRFMGATLMTYAAEST